MEAIKEQNRTIKLTENEKSIVRGELDLPSQNQKKAVQADNGEAVNNQSSRQFKENVNPSSSINGEGAAIIVQYNNDDDMEEINISDYEDEDSVTDSESQRKHGISTTASKGTETCIGSKNLDDDISQDDTIATRSTTSEATPNSLVRNHTNSSSYRPQISKSTSSINLGFGNVPSISSSTKLSNITFHDVQQAAATKAERMKLWSVKTFKCTKQVLSEKFGHGTKTIDLKLESKIESLKDTKRNYENMLRLTALLSKHFALIVDSQKALGAAFVELSSSSYDLQDEFRFNAETNFTLANNGQALVKALNEFTSGVATLCNKTITDTLLTVEKYQEARLTYDAYKNELTSTSLRPRTATNLRKLAEIQQKHDTNKEIYDGIHDDVLVKLQFLDENRVKVMQKHLQLFNDAISAYFVGNEDELVDCLKRFRTNSVSAPAEYRNK